MSKLRKAAARALPRKYKNKLRDVVHPAQRLALARMLTRGEPDVGLLSVVIPAYNVAEYITECLSSVISQSYTNLEIIVVDDGSTDETMQLVAGFAKYDRRISVIRLENGGNGRARNFGIVAATGEYLTFADSDDIVAPNAYALMMAAISKSGSDFVVGSSVRLIGKKLQSTKISTNMHARERVGIVIDDFPDILDDVFLWNKVFKKSFWDVSVAPIPEGILYEDQESTARAFVRAQSFDVLEEVVYFWRQRNDGSSITQGKRTQKDLDDRISVASSVTSLLIEKSTPQVVEKWFVRLFGNDLVPYYEQVPYTDDRYWSALRSGVDALSELMIESVNGVDRLVTQLDPHARVMLRLTATGMKDELEQVVVDRMEIGTGFQIELRDGQFYANLNYAYLLQEYSGASSLGCDPSLMQLDAQIDVRGWTDNGDLLLSGHAFLRGLTDSSSNTVTTVVVETADGAWHELPVELTFDENLDARANDAFATHGNSAFTAVVPASLLAAFHSGFISAKTSLSVLGYEFSAKQSVLIPKRVPVYTLFSPHVYDFAVHLEREEFSIDIHWGNGRPTREVYLSTQQRRLDPVEIETISISAVRYTFRLAQAKWGRQAFAPSSGAYTLRHGALGATVSSIGTKASDSTIDFAWRLPLDYQLKHAHVQAWTTRSGHFAVSIGAPLGPDERGRYQQRSLQQVFNSHSNEVLGHVVFESFGGKVCTDSPRALSDELHRSYPHLKIYWSIVDYSVSFPVYAEPVVRGSRVWYEIINTAQLVVNNQNFPHYFHKNPKQKYLQTWHGTPLKRIGIDAPNHTISPLYRKSVEREASTWDALIAQNSYSAATFSKSFGHSGEILDLGYPRNDALVVKENFDSRKRARQAINAARDSLVVLYAPTWRDTHKDGKEKLIPIAELELEVLLEKLPSNARILMRSHHNIVPTTGGFVDDRVLDVSDHPEVNELMLASDVLITDYSSILFDYSVMSKPIIFFAPDLEEYRDSIRGFYLDYEKIAQASLCTTTSEVVLIVETIMQGDTTSLESESLYQATHDIYNEYANKDDGCASNRVVQELIRCGLLEVGITDS